VPIGWTGSTAYQRGPDRRLRPYLFFELQAVDGSWRRAQGLIDTGADVSVLPLARALQLGVEAASLAPERGQQVAGSIVIWRGRTPLRARIVGLEANEFDLRPAFVQALQTPLLGRTDFMSRWGVTINEPARRLALERLV
jgi:hypothetical protein